MTTYKDLNGYLRFKKSNEDYAELDNPFELVVAVIITLVAVGLIFFL